MRFTRWFALAVASLLSACGGPLLAPSVGERGSAAGTEAARAWSEYRLRAAQRIHATSPGETFEGPLPDPLQSIPVLQVHLNRDGSVRKVDVLRVPRQSPQTVDMAIRAVRRAAPFGSVGHLPQPWQFNETFLYNDELKFQLRTLVEAP